MENRILRLFLAVMGMAFSLKALSQGIYGTVTDGNGSKLPYTHIFAPQLKKGTTSNAEGVYALVLPAGTWRIEYRNLGFITSEKEVVVTSDNIRMDVSLRERTYRIGEIKVLASGEDPAVYVMRRAIAMAPYYKNQVSEYSSMVYLKGSGKFGRIPRMFRKTLEKQGVKANDVFSMESLSRIEFRLPDQLKQHVVAQRSSGNDNNTSPMPMITSDLYNASRYGVVSPFDRQALQVYSFRLLGMFEDQGRMINRIQVTPKRKGNDVFEGIVNVADGYWSVHSADLKLAAPMMLIHMKQLYGPVDVNTWMPVSLRFDVKFEGMGFGLEYIYVASVSDYQVKLNPGLDHGFIEKQRRFYEEEMQLVSENIRSEEPTAVSVSGRRAGRLQELLHREELNNRESRELNRMLSREAASANPPQTLEIEQRIFLDSTLVERNSEYWDAMRPIPLTPEETEGFRRKDSLMVIRSAPSYRDSVEHARTKFRLRHVFLGATYSYHPSGSNKRNTLTIPGLAGGNTLLFNTVDGIRASLPFRWYKRDTLGHAMTIAPEISYAFARKKMDATVSASYTWKGSNMATAGFSGGTSTADYNMKSGMPVFANEFHSLWYERNYKKMFRRDFITVYQQYELLHGLNLRTDFAWADRHPLQNHSEYRIIDWKGRSYTDNVPVNPFLQPEHTQRNRLAESRVVLTWHPRQRYYMRNGFKYYADSRLPVISFTWRRGIPGIFGSVADFDYLEAGMRHRLTPGIGNILEYGINAGGFVTQNNLHFSDFRHFNTHFPWLVGSPDFDSFGLNPFYRTSTLGSFAEAHAAFESGRILVKRIPALGNTLITEQLFVNFLHTDQYKYYSEFGYRIRNIFALLSLEGVIALRAGRFNSAGAKLILQIPGVNP